MTDLLIAALLGLLEGLTEFVPVSSTGHLLLAGHFLGFQSAGKTFEVVIQLGAVLALMVVYAARLWQVFSTVHKDPAALRFVVSVALAFVTPRTHLATPAMIPIGAMASLAGVLGWIGACERVAAHLPDLSRLSRLTPGIYFAHLPIVCFGQYVLRPVDASPLVKTGQVTIAALVVSAGVAAALRAVSRRRRRSKAGT